MQPEEEEEEEEGKDRCKVTSSGGNGVILGLGVDLALMEQGTTTTAKTDSLTLEGRRKEVQKCRKENRRERQRKYEEVQ